MEKCIEIILSAVEDKPCLFVGGGGYDRPNTARYWAKITSQIVSKSNFDHLNLSNDIPETPFFSLYGPSFELSITKGLRMSDNTDEDIKKISETALSKYSN